MAGKYLLTTLGCKVNQYESQQLREVLESCGLRQAQPGETTDIALVNTCTVTATALRKSRQAIRRVACDGRAPVVVFGCGGAANATMLATLDGVVAVFGHDVDACAELRRLLANRLELGPTYPVADTNHVAETTRPRPDVIRYDVSMNPDARERGRRASTPRTTSSQDIITPSPNVKTVGLLAGGIHSFTGHQRALLKVQDGCDAGCTYCIVQRLRPRLRSKPIEAAVSEARDLIRAGHREIIVTGVFLGAYGRETAIRGRWTTGQSSLAVLVDVLAQVEGLSRLRLSSLEPGDVNASLLDVLTRRETCVPHLHLPLQSGSAEVLRRMNRQYTRDQFVRMIDRVRSALDRPAISTDIIVGFPGETEGDFEASCEMARYAGFSKIHMFPFSPREGTAAARWRHDFVPSGVVRDRMQRLADVERECSLAFRRRFVGQIERVIVEDHNRLDNRTSPRHPAHRGRADRYFEVQLDASGVSPGDLVSVRIDRVAPERTYGAYLGTILARDVSGCGQAPVNPAGITEDEKLRATRHRDDA